MNRLVGWVIGALALLAWGPGVWVAAAQCSMCRTGLLNSPEGQQLIAGFNSGILFLLAVPVLIFCSALLYYWRATRRRLKPASRADAAVPEEQFSPTLELSKPT